MKKFFLTVLVLLAAVSINVSAQTPKIRLEAMPEKLEVKANETFLVKVNVNVPKPWYTYSTKEQIGPDGIGPTMTEFSVIPKEAAVINGRIKSSSPKTKYDSGFEMNIEYHTGFFHFFIPLKAKKNLNFAKDKIEIAIYMQLCDTARCLPPEDYTTRILNKLYPEAEAALKEAEAENVNIDSN